MASEDGRKRNPSELEMGFETAKNQVLILLQKSRKPNNDMAIRPSITVATSQNGARLDVDNDGQWSVHSQEGVPGPKMAGLPDVLSGYAQVADRGYGKLLLQMQGKGDSDDLAREAATYIEANRERLLKGLTGALKNAGRKFTHNQH